ncbi:hypothetical protein LSAT2_030213 [Lamellibrachia satsuma]|nr:hypothetical protein LSAT2_030213 [Lamellibrachia satsuma]
MVKAKNKVMVVKAKDKTVVVKAKEKVAMVKAKNKVVVVKAKDKVKDKAEVVKTKDKIVVIKAKDKIKDKAVVVKTKDKVAMVKAKNKVMVVKAMDKFKDKAMVVKAKDKVAMVKAKNKVMVVKAKDKVKAVRVTHRSRVSCGGRPYNVNVQICCGGDIKRKPRVQPACCEKTAYSKQTHKRCNRNVERKIQYRNQEAYNNTTKSLVEGKTTVMMVSPKGDRTKGDEKERKGREVKWVEGKWCEGDSREGVGGETIAKAMGLRETGVEVSGGKVTGAQVSQATYVVVANSEGCRRSGHHAVERRPTARRHTCVSEEMSSGKSPVDGRHENAEDGRTTRTLEYAAATSPTRNRPGSQAVASTSPSPEPRTCVGTGGS